MLFSLLQRRLQSFLGCHSDGFMQSHAAVSAIHFPACVSGAISDLNATNCKLPGPALTATLRPKTHESQSAMSESFSNAQLDSLTRPCVYQFMKDGKPLYIG